MRRLRWLVIFVVASSSIGCARYPQGFASSRKTLSHLGERVRGSMSAEYETEGVWSHGARSSIYHWRLGERLGWGWQIEKHEITTY